MLSEGSEGTVSFVCRGDSTISAAADAGMAAAPIRLAACLKKSLRFTSNLALNTPSVSSPTGDPILLNRAKAMCVPDCNEFEEFGTEGRVASCGIRRPGWILSVSLKGVKFTLSFIVGARSISWKFI